MFINTSKSHVTRKYTGRVRKAKSFDFTTIDYFVNTKEKKRGNRTAV